MSMDCMFIDVGLSPKKMCWARGCAEYSCGMLQCSNAHSIYGVSKKVFGMVCILQHQNTAVAIPALGIPPQV